jgi:cyclin B
MRSILVDWLVEVHYRFELLQETLYLTVNIMDRYLQAEQTERGKLQLVGVTAMLIASKYEEMYPPEVGDFVYISDNAYRRDQILAMEQKMLRVLDFALGSPLPLHFLRRNSRAGRADGTMHTMAKYLMELTIGSAKMLRYVPSEIAAAATYISREVAGEAHLWNPTVEHYAHYTHAEIGPVIDDMKDLLANSVTSKFQAVRTKFSRSKYMRISKDAQLEAYIAQLA